MVNVGAIALELSVRACDLGLADLALDDVGGWRGYIVEEGLVHAKVPGQD